MKLDNQHTVRGSKEEYKAAFMPCKRYDAEMADSPTSASPPLQ